MLLSIDQSFVLQELQPDRPGIQGETDISEDSHAIPFAFGNGGILDVVAGDMLYVKTSARQIKVFGIGHEELIGGRAHSDALQVLFDPHLAGPEDSAYAHLAGSDPCHHVLGDTLDVSIIRPAVRKHAMTTGVYDAWKKPQGRTNLIHVLTSSTQ
jgi:hypothetical protein